jgi:hypothetical protein
MTPPLIDGRGRQWQWYPPHMLEYSKKNSPHFSQGVCECGSDIFHTLFGPEDPHHDVCHLVALICADCGDETRSHEQQYDA